MSWWDDQFAIYRAPDRISAEIRAKHLQAVTRLTPVVMAANVLNGALVCAAFWDGAPRANLLAWAAILLATAALGVLAWWRRRHRPALTASPAAIVRATRHAALLALIWAYVPAAWFVAADPAHRLLIATLTSGMLCAGAFALATVPSASMVYIAILTAASAYALAACNEPLYYYVAGLLFIYAGVIASGVLSAARVFTARLVSEREASRQSQMVGLLLRDFEEHATDMLWEIDAEGRFTHVSSRLATLLCGTPDGTPPTGLMELVDQGSPGGAPDPGRALLRETLAAFRPFRDLVVPIVTRQGERWWSITAKPVIDEHGRAGGWRGVIADVTGERRAQQRLEQLALSDPLTGLANRQVLRERLERFAGPAAGTRLGGALLFIDLDHFKTINDTLGHSVGDAVLQVVAARLQSVVRDRDLLARLGGDEFAIVLSDAGSADDVGAIARRLLAELAAPCVAHGCSVALGASVGIALLPEHGATVDEALANADLALYAAKAAGRGCFEFFAARLGERPRRRLALEQELRLALGRNQLALHWQPQFDLASWQPAGAEALLRWQHPELGAVGPAEFIPVAEDCGLIEEIGDWVLRQACREASSLPAGFAISVNVSPAQLMRANFVDRVEAALEAAQLPADRLAIEITESIFIDNVPPALANLRRLKALQVKIVLDDFGTGYSALAYLRRFPFDTLKIDIGFVHELLTGGDSQAIVKTIIALAATLGMTTVAEGVEEAGQFDVLRAAGCSAMQGFFAARPMPIGELGALLAGWTGPPPVQLPRSTPQPACAVEG